MLVATQQKSANLIVVTTIKLTLILPLFQVPHCDLPIGFRESAGVLNGIFGDELHKPLLCDELRLIRQNSASQFPLYYPLSDAAGAVPNQQSNIFRGQRIWLCLPYFVEKSLKFIDIDLCNGIYVLPLTVEDADRSGHGFRCCFLCPEISDYIVNADLIAVGFLSAVLTGNVPIIKQPFCLTLADVANTVQLVCAYNFRIFLVEE